MSVPILKLGYLLVKTLSKPIAKLVQQQAVEHPKFRSICASFSQAYHRLEVRLRTRVSDRHQGSLKDQPVPDIKPLSEEKAIQLGGIEISILFRDRCNNTYVLF